MEDKGRSQGASAVLAWTLAWGVTGIALYISGVFNSPRIGPLWLALGGGAIPWAIAGSLHISAGSGRIVLLAELATSI